VAVAASVVAASAEGVVAAVDLPEAAAASAAAALRETGDMARSRSARFLRHLATDHHSVRRVFPADTLRRIEEAVAESERRHRGQLCVAIEGALPASRVLKREKPRERALEVFGQLRVWDTEENSGVLIYVLLADHAVEIVADRGIDRRVGKDAWQSICRTMEDAFRAGRFGDGMVDGVTAISKLLADHFPRDSEGGANELSDRPVIL
jgi:uncharacterized membrane protein